MSVVPNDFPEGVRLENYRFLDNHFRKWKYMHPCVGMQCLKDPTHTHKLCSYSYFTSFFCSAGETKDEVSDAIQWGRTDVLANQFSNHQ